MLQSKFIITKMYFNFMIIIHILVHLIQVIDHGMLIKVKLVVLLMINNCPNNNS